MPRSSYWCGMMVVRMAFIPQLYGNQNTNVVVIIRHSEQPRSKLANRQSRTALSNEYILLGFNDVQDVFTEVDLGSVIDSGLVAAPHSMHYEIRRRLPGRRVGRERPLHILMEKPMTANVDQAKKLHYMVTEYKTKGDQGCFRTNHKANYRENAQTARNIVGDRNELGSICFSLDGNF